MLLLRALNEFDIVSNPNSNGLASKKMIYDLTKAYYENIKDSEYLRLNQKEKDVFIKEHMLDYLISHKHKLEKYYRKRNKMYRDVINSLLDNPNPAGYIMLKKYISSLQGHLLHGSRTNTNWISTSKNFNSIERYYNNQDVHSVALIKSNTNGIIDSDRILTIDVSSTEKILNNSLLCNKIECADIDLLAALSTEYPSILNDFIIDYNVPTNPSSTGFNYSKASSEVCIYEYLPSNHILGIIESLQMDLIRYHLFDFEFFKLDKTSQETYLRVLKSSLLKRIKATHDPFLLHVYEELYINNKNINNLINPSDSKEKVVASRNKILRYARGIPNIQIKR